MLNKKIEKALNEQLAMEAAASFNYLAMASWCEQQNLDGCAKFLYAQAEEENGHMMKIFRYLNTAGGRAVTPEIKQPKLQFKDVIEVFTMALNSEKQVTQHIYKLNEMAYDEKQYAAYQFLQYYIVEQEEEENLFTNILAKMNMIGIKDRGLYYIDKEMEIFRAPEKK